MAKLFTFPSLIISLFLFSFNALATVPPSATFKHVNNGEFGPFVVEYLGNYRVISIANAPFQLAFYNTTPNAFTLALRMASTRSESLFRWVWEAKRGNPTNTANRGVVGFKLLSNGNMVLHDSKGKFIWQSFDHPTDTLLVGQSLRIGGPTKLVSRASAQNNVDGAYSLVMEPKGLVLQYKGLNSPKPLVYFKSSVRPSTQDGTLQTVTLNVEPDTHEGFAYNVVLDYTVAKSSSGGTGNLILARPKYNSTLSILRLMVTLGDSTWGTECELPERCGSFGVCEENQCIGCPLRKGLLGWNKNCQPKKVSSCRPNGFSYYKLEGVNHFMSQYNEGVGPIKESDWEEMQCGLQVFGVLLPQGNIQMLGC
ncbi:hypothetical protein V6N12_015361 [Hibiscus sabdariffa]|uniref:Bulb-type lectin domain-containing protein n=1 Tax=Hibiscus sabdariffa TaxID=183260 RepID=A0ABR2DNU8_9ROSI